MPFELLPGHFHKKKPWSLTHEMGKHRKHQDALDEWISRPPDYKSNTNRFWFCWKTNRNQVSFRCQEGGKSIWKGLENGRRRYKKKQKKLQKWQDSLPTYKQLFNRSAVKADCAWEGQLNVCLLSRQFSDKIQDMHHSWTRSWLAPVAKEWLKSVQSGQFAAAELESLHSARLPRLN